MPGEEKYPLVSIVLSTYNGGMYLAEQLDSIFAQTYPNIEVIAADDYSSDNTLEILSRYSTLHKNLIIVESSINRGYIKNFEIGMSHASGEFISACDQDDVWLNNKVALMVESIGDYPMLYCDSYLVDADLNYLKKKQLSELKNLATYTNCLVFATDNCVAGHATLITKEFFKKTQPFSDRIAHDWWFAYLATFHGGIKYLDMPLVKYRNHSTNVIGAVKVNRTKKTIAERRERKRQDEKKIRDRVQLFFENCPDSFVEEKKVIGEIVRCYQQKTFSNNCKRVLLFLKHKRYFLAIKKAADWYKTFFCFKMFFKIR